MKPLLIAIDVDSTIYDIMPEWLAEYNKRTGEHLTTENITEWSVHNIMTKLSPSDVYNLLEKLNYTRGLLPQAKRTIKALKDAGHIIVFHSRNFSHKQSILKLKMLTREFKDIEFDVVYSQNGSKKANYLQAADVIIEDSPKFVPEIRGVNRETIILLMTQPWNQNLERTSIDPPFIRCEDWEAVRNELQKFKVI